MYVYIEKNEFIYRHVDDMWRCNEYIYEKCLNRKGGVNGVCM